MRCHEWLKSILLRMLHGHCCIIQHETNTKYTPAPLGECVSFVSPLKATVHPLSPVIVGT